MDRFVAKVKYEPNRLTILEDGLFVKCAVTGEYIYIDDLRYWSVTRQEAYINAEASLKRELEIKMAREPAPTPPPEPSPPPGWPPSLPSDQPPPPDPPPHGYE